MADHTPENCSSIHHLLGKTGVSCANMALAIKDTLTFAFHFGGEDFQLHSILASATESVQTLRRKDKNLLPLPAIKLSFLEQPPLSLIAIPTQPRPFLVIIRKPVV